MVETVQNEDSGQSVTWEDVLAYCKMGGIRVDKEWQHDAYVITHPVSRIRCRCSIECPEGAMHFLAGDGR